MNAAVRPKAAGMQRKIRLPNIFSPVERNQLNCASPFEESDTPSVLQAKLIPASDLAAG
jgi:hypothetical protein